LKIRAVIVEDESLARERIRHLLTNDNQIEIIGEYATGSDAVNAIQRDKPDLLFLDIQMPGMDGFSLLKQISPRIPHVIFVTAFDDYAVKAFEVNAMDYILKPFTRKRFEEALRRMKARFAQNPDSGLAKRVEAFLEQLQAKQDYLKRLAIKTESGVLLVKIGEIDWIESDDNYIRIHCGKSHHLMRETISALEKRLDPERFLRIHRRLIVNVDRIKQLFPWFQRSYCVLLQDGTKLPVGRNYKEKLKSLSDHL
jgi:two-component system LytT family response regulator